MIDATRKKTIFINKVSTELEFKDTCAHHGRAEDFAHNPQFRSQFDFVTARAVAELPTFTELMLPFVKKGVCLCYEGRNSRSRNPKIFKSFV